MTKIRPLAKLFITIIGISVIFGLGYGIGNGDLSLVRLANRQSPISDDLPENLDYSSVEQVYDSLRVSYDGELKTENLIKGLKQGLAQASGDPYTEYLSSEETEDFGEQLSGSFTGIGAELSKDKEAIVVVAPLAGYPAEKAGVRPKDIISKINDESTFNMTITEAVNKIRGPKDSKVTLTVIRGGTQELKFEITRDQISIPSVTNEILEGNIGYIKISRYGEDTADLTRQAALTMKQANVKGIILDLRNNPGGLLPASVDVSSLWLDKGQTVLDEKRGGKTVKTYSASGNKLLGDIPTIVLINEGSASASEITAGALKDHGKARLLGTKTYGKGSVQQLVDLRDQDLLKVTVGRWFTPGGKNIDKEGIEPDEKVERSEEDFKAERDPQKDKALELLRK